MTENSKSSKISLYFLILAILIMVYQIYIYYLDYIAITGDDYTDEMYNIFADRSYFLTIIYSIPVIICFIIWLNVFGIKSFAGKVWLFLTIGIILWIIGDMFYVYEWFAFQNEEFPEDTPARYIYILGYIIMITGLILQIKATPTKLTSSNIVILVLLVAIISAIISYLVLIPLAAYEPDENISRYMQFFLIIYCVFDIITICLVMILTFKYKGGEFSTNWRILLLGFLIAAIYDLLNAYLGYLIPYEEGFWSPDYYWYFTDQLYSLMYLVWGYGALKFYDTIKSASI